MRSSVQASRMHFHQRRGLRTQNHGSAMPTHTECRHDGLVSSFQSAVETPSRVPVSSMMSLYLLMEMK
eukprot:557932-Prorocentrum_lima.AAC.1